MGLACGPPTDPAPCTLLAPGPGPPLHPAPQSPLICTAPPCAQPRPHQLLRVVTAIVPTPTFLAAFSALQWPLGLLWGAADTPEPGTHCGPSPWEKCATAQNFTPSFQSFKGITDPGSSRPSWEESMGFRLSPDQGRRCPPQPTGGETEGQKGWRREGCPRGCSEPGGQGVGSSHAPHSSPGSPGGSSEAGTTALPHPGPGDAGPEDSLQPAGLVPAPASPERRSSPSRPAQAPPASPAWRRAYGGLKCYSCDLQLAVETGVMWFPLASVSPNHSSSPQVADRALGPGAFPGDNKS